MRRETFHPSLPGLVAGCIANHCANYSIWWTDVLAPRIDNVLSGGGGGGDADTTGVLLRI